MIYIYLICTDDFTPFEHDPDSSTMIRKDSHLLVANPEPPNGPQAYNSSYQDIQLLPEPTFIEPGYDRRFKGFVPPSSVEDIPIILTPPSSTPNELHTSTSLRRGERNEEDDHEDEMRR